MVEFLQKSTLYSLDFTVMSMSERQKCVFSIDYSHAFPITKAPEALEYSLALFIFFITGVLNSSEIWIFLNEFFASCNQFNVMKRRLRVWNQNFTSYLYGPYDLESKNDQDWLKDERLPDSALGLKDALIFTIAFLKVL